mgnify:CR=1 FL=1
MKVVTIGVENRHETRINEDKVPCCAMEGAAIGESEPDERHANCHTIGLFDINIFRSKSDLRL